MPLALVLKPWWANGCWEPNCLCMAQDCYLEERGFLYIQTSARVFCGSVLLAAWRSAPPFCALSLDSSPEATKWHWPALQGTSAFWRPSRPLICMQAEPLVLQEAEHQWCNVPHAAIPTRRKNNSSCTRNNVLFYSLIFTFCLSVIFILLPPASPPFLPSAYFCLDLNI